MTVQLSMLAGAGAQFLDNNANPLSGGKLYTYLAGTTTPAATYTTSVGNVAHANPIVLDAAGRVPSSGEIWLSDSVSYKFVVKTSGDVLLNTYDNITGNSSGLLTALSQPTGSSLVGYIQGSANSVATTVQSVLRREVWVDDFLPVGFDYAADDAWQYIQNAVDSGANQILLGEHQYRISKPVQIGGGVHLVGQGPSATSIVKYTTNVGTGSNTARGGAVTDSYAKNAILIFTHPDGGYNYSSAVRGINLVSDGYIVEYGIYAPRMSQFWLQDVQIYQCKYGWVANDAWLIEFDKVIVNANTQHGINGGSSYGWVGDTYGIWWQNDGSGSGTGTSFNANNCWTRDCDFGWWLYGLSYSNLNACASDNISKSAYTFKLSRINLNGCGFENVQANGSAIACEYSNVVFNSCDNHQIYGGASGSTAMLKVDGGSVVLNSCRWSNFLVANSAYNLIIQNGGKLINNGSTLPTNGNSYISYSNGAQLINNASNPPYLVSTASDALPRYQMGRVRDNQVQEKINKSIASTGTVIATITAALTTNVEYGTCKFRVTHYDASYVGGVGMAEFVVSTYQDAATNYRQSLTMIVNDMAGNGVTTPPTFSISRSGAVWSVTMTPAHGDTTAYTITAEAQMITGMKLALP